MKIKCIYEPRGDIGLEGFQLNHEYKMKENFGKYNIYSLDNEYIECTLNKRKFWKYFTEII